jgi:hypothetical protein
MEGWQTFMDARKPTITSTQLQRLFVRPYRLVFPLHAPVAPTCPMRRLPSIVSHVGRTGNSFLLMALALPLAADSMPAASVGAMADVEGMGRFGYPQVFVFQCGILIGGTGIKHRHGG